VIIADASPLYRLGVQVVLNDADIQSRVVCVDSFSGLTRLLSKRKEAVLVMHDARLNGFLELKICKAGLKFLLEGLLK
jgi:hypothetical protein